MLSRFYEISRLTSEGVPQEAWRKELDGGVRCLTCQSPSISRRSLSQLAGQSMIVRESVSTVGQLLQALDR